MKHCIVATKIRKPAPATYLILGLSACAPVIRLSCLYFHREWALLGTDNLQDVAGHRQMGNQHSCETARRCAVPDTPPKSVWCCRRQPCPNAFQQTPGCPALNSPPSETSERRINHRSQFQHRCEISSRTRMVCTNIRYTASHSSCGRLCDGPQKFCYFPVHTLSASSMSAMSACRNLRCRRFAAAATN